MSNLIVLCGLPGSGKTTLSEYLSDKLRFDVYRNDDFRKKLIKDPKYSVDEKLKVYNSVRQVFEENGRDAIWDGTFYLPEFRNIVYDLHKTGDHYVVFVEAVCGLEEAKKRITGREKDKYSMYDVKKFEQLVEDAISIYKDEYLFENKIPYITYSTTSHQILGEVNIDFLNEVYAKVIKALENFGE